MVRRSKEKRMGTKIVEGKTEIGGRNKERDRRGLKKERDRRGLKKIREEGIEGKWYWT